MESALVAREDDPVWKKVVDAPIYEGDNYDRHVYEKGITLILVKRGFPESESGL